MGKLWYKYNLRFLSVSHRLVTDISWYPPGSYTSLLHAARLSTTRGSAELANTRGHLYTSLNSTVVIVSKLVRLHFMWFFKK